MEKLPDDILPNIFIRLLAKQLAQMRLVSKSWHALLSESAFIKSHLLRSIQTKNDDGVLLVFSHLFSFVSKPFTAHPSRSPHLELTDFIKLPINHPQSENSRLSKVIGSVNGLICFVYGSSHHNPFCSSPYHDYRDPEVVYIWNPSLSALLTLPPCPLPSHSTRQFFRFGFDPKTDDYKVVKITRRRLSTSPDSIWDIEWLPAEVYSIEWLPVEVYSMRKGSWKLITQRIPSDIEYLLNFDDLCVDGHGGHLHWFCFYNGWKTYLETKSIFTFDLGAETFREISLPDFVSVIGDTSRINFRILAGKLCVMSVIESGECEVWVMDDESWVKRYVFPPFGSRYLYLHGFTSRNEFLFRATNGNLRCYRGLYDPVAATIKIFKHGYTAKIKVVEYVDSLVWVTPAEQ